jgi:hypothetical protein
VIRYALLVAAIATFVLFIAALVVDTLLRSF